MTNILVFFVFAGFGTPELKWASPGIYCSTPLIADIDATNLGSEIIGVTHTTVYCVSATGSITWTAPIIQTNWASPTVAKFSSGYQIITGDETGKVYSIDENGSILWSFTRGTGPWSEVSSPCIANLDTIGEPEILIVGGDGYLYCLDDGGNLLWSRKLGGPTRYPSSAVVSDLDEIGYPEIIIGCNDTLFILDYQGNTKQGFFCQDSIYAGVGIADVDNDNSPEILLPSERGVLYCLNNNGVLEWSCNLSTGIGSHRMISTPAVADIDNDNITEMVIFSNSRQVIYALKYISGAVDTLWKAEAVDWTPYSPPCPFICDIDDDNDKDVIWVGSNFMGIYNGTDGKHPDNSSAPFYKNTYFNSGTGVEHGVSVADIDNDGHVEIVGIYGWNSIGVLECDTAWVDCRNICPTYLYHITDINDDLTVPKKIPHHWKTHNTWLTQLCEGAPAIEEENKHKEDLINITPNPFINTLVIKTNIPVSSLKIYSIDGRLVYRSDYKTNKIIWSSNYSAGIYFCHIKIGKNTYTKKIIKIKQVQ